MIKRANQKKKKGFSLIELIIVLAVMAIIALIAIPNFSAVRDNSKKKADDQTRETIERAMLMLVADETIDGVGAFKFTAPVKMSEDGTATSGGAVDITTGGAVFVGDEIKAINKALKEVNEPQVDKTKVYKVEIDANDNITVTIVPAT